MACESYLNSCMSRNMFGDSTSPDWLTAEQSTGTSIMAIEYDDGVVLGADSRATAGSYVSNRIADKLTKVSEYIYCCRSGSAADTQAIADIVKYHLDFYSTELGEPPLVETAANVFRELCYNYRDSLSAGIIIAGWDKRKGGQVYAVPLGGMCIRQRLAIGGSGSTYVYGYVDSHVNNVKTKKDCLEFVTNSLTLAMSRDGSSGGVVRLADISKDGVEKVTLLADQLPRFYEG